MKYVEKKLKYCPYGSCKVRVYEDGKIQLISYCTMVIEIDENGYILCTGTYSATTRKHIGCFLKEYASNLCYYDMKKIAGTGEVISIRG